MAGVLEALRSGCFYGSSGPRIGSVVAGDGSVEVHCDPSQSVRVVFGVSSGAAVNAGRLGYRYGRRHAFAGAGLGIDSAGANVSPEVVVVGYCDMHVYACAHSCVASCFTKSCGVMFGAGSDPEPEPEPGPGSDPDPDPPVGLLGGVAAHAAMSTNMIDLRIGSPW